MIISKNLLLEIELLKFCVEEEGTTDTEKLHIVKEIVERILSSEK